MDSLLHMLNRHRSAGLLIFLFGAAGLGWHWGVFESSKSNQTRADDAVTAEIPAAHRLQADVQPDFAILETGLVSLREGKGAVRRYRLALNEIYEMTKGREGVHRIPAQQDGRTLAAYASAEAVRSKVWPALVLYPENGPVEKATRRVLTGRMLVELKEASSKVPDMNAAGLEILERRSYSSKHLITQSRSGSPLEALAAIQKLSGDPAVVSVTPLLKRHYQAAAIPNDPYFADQWHLNNTGQGKGTPGMDAQVKDVWDGLQGEGVRIAIVDDGLETTHPDLAANVDTQPNHWDWTDQDQNPSPNLDLGDFHGTVVGGTAAARGNNGIGVSGVAPRATLVGFRFLQEERAISDEEIADLVMRGNDVIQVKNNSWAPTGGAAVLGTSSDLFSLAMRSAANIGRGGLGVLSVWASGNDRDIGVQGNKNEYANNIHAIAVGALGNTGKLAAYSETGSHLTVVAPSGGGTLGLVSTDVTGLGGYNPNPSIPDYEGEGYSYTRRATGTSFSAPVVSGVCALMLQANPNLSWRDVKEILLRSSKKLEPTSTAWVTRSGGMAGNELLPPIKHHYNYGGGLVQAGDAVNLARNWVPLGPQVTVEKKIDPNLAINYTTKQPEPVVQRFEKLSSIVTPPKPPKRRTLISKFDMRGIQPLRVENVAVTLDIQHAYRGDLSIVLRSPSGVVSQLISPTPYDFGADFVGFTVSSMRHWGESGQGLWTLEITDYTIEGDGLFSAANLTLTGTAAPAAVITSQTTGPQLVAEGVPVTLAVNSTLSTEGGSRTWRKDGKEIKGQLLASLPGVGQQVTDAGIYDHFISNKWGRVTSAVIPVSVVRRQVPASFVNEGATTSLSVVTAGANLVYQWFRNSSPDPLVYNGRVTGTRTAKLTIREAGPLDQDSYYCRVRLMNFNPDPQAENEAPLVIGEINTLPALLQIRRRPVVNASTLNTPITVSENLLRQITADNEVTRWSVTGLPPGVTFDPKTARILGAPTKSGRYTLIITAFNSVGSSTPVTVIWDVQGLPAGIIGTFHGLVDRHDLYNGGFGGAVTLTTTSTGSYTGTVTRGVHRHTFTGRLNASSTNGILPTGHTLLTRRAPYGPLTFRFALAATGGLDGTLTDLALVPENNVRVTGLRAAYSITAPATSLVGRWNTAYELPAPLLGSSTYPQGAAWGSQTVTATGLATLAGRLADGTAFTCSAGLSATGSAPMHLMLYGNFGSIQGWQTLNSITRASSAALTWMKSPGTATHSYASGFPVHDLLGSGASYTVPAIGEMLFGITSAANNASLTFTQGGLAQPFVQRFTLGANNVLFFPTGSANPHQIQFTLALTTGILTGTGATMDIAPLNPALNRQRPGTFSALLIPQREQAVGHFLLPTSTSPTAPILSGKVIGGEAVE